MDLSIVIPNYNGKALLEKNLPQVFKILPKAQIIIVDDASTDESVAFIKKHFPKITLIEKVTNSGFAATVNLGVKAARHDLIMLLNTDAVPQKDFITPILSYFKNEKVFAVGCLDESEEQGVIVKRGRGIGNFSKGFLLHRRGEVDQNNTLWVSGGSSFFKKSIWEKLGGMNEIYNPFYWEDIDLSYRALKSGYTIFFEPKSIVKHYHNEGSIKVHYKDQKIKEIAYRNQIIFIWENITDQNFWWQHFLFLPYHFLKTWFSDGSPFTKGFFQALLKLPEILRKRKWQKKLFVRTDAQVLAPFSS